MRNHMSNTEKTTASNGRDVFAVLGIFIQFLSTPAQNRDDISVMIGSIPSGAVIPLHSHADPEIFYVLEGTVEVYEDSQNTWRSVKAGNALTIPGNVRHALRNSSTSMVQAIMVSKENIYNFFRELARPADGEALSVPDPKEMSALFQAAEKYDCWLGSLEENAAIGISLR